MGKITVTPCDIEGLYVIEPTVFKDERGYWQGKRNGHAGQHEQEVGLQAGAG